MDRLDLLDTYTIPEPTRDCGKKQRIDCACRNGVKRTGYGFHEENNDDEVTAGRCRVLYVCRIDPWNVELTGRTTRREAWAASAGSLRLHLSRWLVRNDSRKERQGLPEGLCDRLRGIRHVLIDLSRKI